MIMFVFKRIDLTGLFSFLFLMIVSATIAEAQIVVTNTNDNGEGSLRWAIQQANSEEGLTTIAFNINGQTPHSIFPQSPLPAIIRPVFLDATSQPGYDASSPVPVIILDGSEFTGANASGFVLDTNSSGSTIRGFSIVGFDPGVSVGGQGIIILSNNNTVTGNYIGMLPDGSPKGNEGVGIIIGGSSDNTIGGPDIAERNVISTNRFDGIQLEDSNNNSIQNNFIGTSPDGTEAQGNGNDGISLINSNDNVIGGVNSENRNIISANLRNGLTLNSASGNRFEGNLIGLDNSGDAGIGNGRFGVFVFNSPNNIFDNNTISHNGQDVNAAGIDILGSNSTGNSVISNRIGTNISGTVAIGNQGPGISVRSLNTNIGDGTLEGRNIISGNSAAGITLQSFQYLSANTSVRNNFIGVSADGLSPLPNGSSGIVISESSGNIIGGPTIDDRNIISGNLQDGILLAGSDANSNYVLGNYIGLNSAGTGAIGNGRYGVFLNSSGGNFIGGTLPGERNIISGNSDDGVYLINSATTGNIISGNYIGLAPNGETGIGNGLSGISLVNAPENLISANVISHNGQSFSAQGIGINGTGASGNQIISNKIGTNSSGTMPLPNNGLGLFISSANTVIGGSTSEQGNIISGNTLDGILISNIQADASGATLQNNLIGVGADKITPIGNGRDGIAIFGSSNIIIGGESGLIPMFQNIIANNTRNGVSLEVQSGETPRFNGILGNSIYSNGARGIALGLASRVPNDPDDSDDGPNKLQNFPEIDSIGYDDVSHAFDLTYIVSSAPQNSAYPIRVEFFLTEGTTQGKTYLGSDVFEESDYLNFINNGVEKSITLSLLSTIEVPDEFFVTSTATDAELNTSEFSDLAPSTDPVAGVVYTVTNTNDDGEGSLRWAITEANNSTFRDTIQFDIDGPVPHVINIESQFVSFTNPVLLDATTQPGYDSQSGVPVIVLDGSAAPQGSAALVFTTPTSGSSIKGFSIVGFPGHAIILISDENEVLGNYIGILPDGTVSSNTGDGIEIRSGSNNVIGAAGIENRNIISGNKIGININQGATGNIIRNNLIGTTANGESSAANSEDGILITSSSANIIGGDEVAYRNIIGANTRNGITIQGSNATDNLIFGNHIGVDISGESGLGNGIRGVHVFNSPGNIISGNVISHNGQASPLAGVEIFGEFAVNNQLLGNRIGTNADGTAELANTASGIVVRALNTSIVGNVISGNTTYGIFVTSFQATSGNTVIQDNLIGISIDGVTPIGNKFDGIFIDNSSSNIIGGSDSGSGNVISGNNRHGINIQGENSSDNNIKGNLIGLDHTGNNKVANDFDGILFTSTGGNFIGSFEESDRNIISGNTRYGIHIQGTSASGNNIIGNYIGIDGSGLNGIGNGSYGLYLFNAPENQIAENVISHNGQLVNTGGVYLLGAGAEGNSFKANKIGTDITGNVAIGNKGSGMVVRTSGSIIGGSNPADRNVISGNTINGIFVLAAGDASGSNTILNNYIGIGADGVTPIGNAFDGINISGSSNNTVGEQSAQTAISPNVIAHNGRNGITLQVFNSVNPLSNAILSNSIFSNNFRGIDLGLTGRTPNDPDDSDNGPNKLQNYPEMSGLHHVSEENRLDITYVVPSNPINSFYPIRVEFFLSDDTDQGKKYLGFDLFEEEDYSAFVNNGFQKSIQLALAQDVELPIGFSLTATATDDEMNTSEFAETITVTTPPSIVTLTSPQDGAVNVSVDPTLVWTPADDAGTYTIQLSETVDFDLLLLNESGLTATEFTAIGLDYETTYYWRVRASNQAGDGEWSTIFSFTTKMEMITVTKIEIIGENGGVFTDEASGVELTFPEGALSSDTEITFGIYNTIPEGATISGLLVSLTGPNSEPITFNEPVLIKVNYDPDNLPIGVTENNLNLLRYTEANGEWNKLDTTVDTIQKTASAFTLGFSGFGAGLIDGDLTQPPVVTLNTPENNSVGVAVNPTFTWQAASTADSYQLQVSQTDDFGSSVIDQSNISTTEFESGGLEYETVYFWRVRATNEAGDGEWSQAWSFTTEDEPSSPPGIVTLFSPADGATDVSVPSELSWQELQDADSYTVQVSTESGFTFTVVDQSGIEDTSYQVSNLNMNTNYYWRVRGVNQAGNGEWSQEWSFTTGELSSPGMLAVSTADNAPELSWDASPSGSVSGYNVYRAASPSALELLAELDASTVSYTDTEVPQGGSFYAVTATASGNSESAFTNVVSFFRVDLQAGSQWQLVSHAVSGAEADVSGSLVYGFENVYRSEQTLKPGNGYWIKDDGGASYTLAGSGASELELDLNAGWNLVGGPVGALAVDDINDPSAILTTTPVYSYNGVHYEQVNELLPGSGYWLFAESAGQVSMSLDLTPAAASSSEILAATETTNSNSNTTASEKDRLVVSSGGLIEELVIYGEYLSRDQKYSYLRPPLAPDQALDVRTSEGFSAMYGSSSGLMITSVAYPVTLRLEASSQSASSYLLLGEDQSGATRQWTIDAGSEIVLTYPYERLSLQRVSPGEFISETLLESGYPNPFNPTTNIRYRLVDQTEVLLEVYDLAGRRVATLVNQNQQSGAYIVPFDGSGLASGVYFVRLQAGSYINIQKLTLIK